MVRDWLDVQLNVCPPKDAKSPAFPLTLEKWLSILDEMLVKSRDGLHLDAAEERLRDANDVHSLKFLGQHFVDLFS